MKKLSKKLILVSALLIILGIYYYVTLPAINIHAAGFWTTLELLIAIVTIMYAVAKMRKITKTNVVQVKTVEYAFKELKLVKAGCILFIIVLLVFAAGNILSSPIINADRYQKLMDV